jgi:hypothetical protein
MADRTDDDEDEFDDQFAAQLLGAYVLVGITNFNHSGEVQDQRQFHGRVIRASPKDGVVVVDNAGEEHWLPPHRNSYIPADPGEYRLRSTGETVVDPDYLSTWRVYPPDRH